MIKEKYKQLCLFSHIGGIYSIEFTQPIAVIERIIQQKRTVIE